MRHIYLLLLSIAVAVSAAGAAAPAASAHQNGCHRWHSCPSDNGSYVCGDLGYTTYCPTTPAPPPPVVEDLNCPDFATQQAAQDFFDANPGDPSGLDADGDGVACDDNPCPCSPQAAPPPPPPTFGGPSPVDTPSADCVAAREDVADATRRVRQWRKRVARAHGGARRRAARKLRRAREDLRAGRGDVERLC